MKGPGWTGDVRGYPLQPRWKAWFPSELERREAARFEGITWEQFMRLPGTPEVAEQIGASNSKCEVIAHYRMAKLYEAVMADLHEKHPPPAKKPKNRGRSWA